MAAGVSGVFVIEADLVVLAPPVDHPPLEVDVRPPKGDDDAKAMARLTGEHQGQVKQWTDLATDPPHGLAVQDGFGGDIESGVFRRDLYQRVAGVVIELPPLTARPEDVVPLAEHFAAFCGRRLEPGVERVLLSYAWPGNVRELRLVIERAGELVKNGTLPSAALAEAIALGKERSMRPVPPFVESSRSHWTREEALTVLRSNAWDVQRAAAALHVGRTTLFKRLKALGISRAERKFTRSPAFTERSRTT